VTTTATLMPEPTASPTATPIPRPLRPVELIVGHATGNPGDAVTVPIGCRALRRVRRSGKGKVSVVGRAYRHDTTPSPPSRNDKPSSPASLASLAGEDTDKESIPDLPGRLAPVRLGHAEVIEHPLRPQKARRHGRHRDGTFRQLLRERKSHTDDRSLHQIVEEVSAAEVLIAVRDLDDVVMDDRRRSSIAVALR
jgi:hypothetical protein